METFCDKVCHDDSCSQREGVSPITEKETSCEKDSGDECPRKRQALDYHAVDFHLRTKCYPPGMSRNQKANFRRQSKPFKIIKNKLWWRKKLLKVVEDTFGEGNLENMENTELFDRGFRIVLATKEERDEKVKLIHENADTSVEAKALHSHHGRDKSTQLLQERYYWVGMVENMRDYCAACTVCEKENTSILKVIPKLRPVSMPPKVMYQIGVDLVTMPTVDGFTYIYVAICYFSKWVEAKAAKTKEAYSVARFLWEDIICRHGCPRIQINDQGRELVNQISDELHKFSGAKQRITSAYHPQANGMTEKQNHTILRRLVKCLESIDQWPDALPGVLFACRAAVHSATKYKPFYLMYLRHPILPMDLQDMEDASHDPNTYLKLSDDGGDDNPIDEEQFSKILKAMLSVRERMHEMALNNIKKAQKRYKKNYDKRHRTDVQYKVGDFVFLDNPRHKNRKGKGDALSTRSGPYQIMEIIDESRVVLKNTKSNAILKSHFSMEHIFPCQSRSTKIFDLEEDEDKIFAEESNSVNIQTTCKGDNGLTPDKVHNEQHIQDLSHISMVTMDYGKNENILPLKNGTVCSAVDICGVQVQLLNTCAFDSIMHILAEACRKSIAYDEFIIDHLDDPVMSFIKLMAKDGPSPAVYEKRAEILLQYFGPSRRPLRGREVVVNCTTNCTVLVEKLFSKVPGAQELKTCSGKACEQQTAGPIPRPVLFVKKPQEGMKDLESAARFKLNHLSTSTCYSKVSDGVHLTSPGVVKYDGVLRCNGRTEISCHLTNSHLFLEVREDNRERLLECSVRPGDIPDKLKINGTEYKVRGLVEFRGPVKATINSMGHYIGHVREDRAWCQYNDLASERQVSDEHAEVRCHMIIFTV